MNSLSLLCVSWTHELTRLYIPTSPPLQSLFLEICWRSEYEKLHIFILFLRFKSFKDIFLFTVYLFLIPIYYCLFLNLVFLVDLKVRHLKINCVLHFGNPSELWKMVAIIDYLIDFLKWLITVLYYLRMNNRNSASWIDTAIYVQHAKSTSGSPYI